MGRGHHPPLTGEAGLGSFLYTLDEPSFFPARGGFFVTSAAAPVIASRGAEKSLRRTACNRTKYAR